MIEHYLDTIYEVVHNTIVELPCKPKWSNDVISEISTIFSIELENASDLVKNWAIKNGLEIESWEHSLEQKKYTLNREEYLEFLDLKNNAFFKSFHEKNMLDFDMILYFNKSQEVAMDIFLCCGYIGPIRMSVKNRNLTYDWLLAFNTSTSYEAEENKKTNEFWQRWIKTEDYDKISRKKAEH